MTAFLRIFNLLAASVDGGQDSQIIYLFTLFKWFVRRWFGWIGV